MKFVLRVISADERPDAPAAWKVAVAADASDAAVEEATTKLLDTLEGRPTPIDGVIAFAQGPAIELMGEETAAQMLAAQQERKVQGAKWCGCEGLTNPLLKNWLYF